MSLYTALFPLKDLSVNAICKCIDQFLTLMPKFTILKTDYGAENSKALTQHLAAYNILHWNSVPGRSAQQGLVERHIRSVKNLVNKFIANRGTMDRGDWVKIIPWVAQCINNTEVHASGLSRYDLLFSPLIAVHAINWGNFDYGLQQETYKKVMRNRQRILDLRQKLHRNSAHRYPVGTLVFKTNEIKPRVSNPKILSPYTDLFMVVSNKCDNSKNSHTFRLYVQNLRTNKISAVTPSMLKRVSVSDLSKSDFDIFKCLNIDYRRLNTQTEGDHKVVYNL